MSRRRSPVSLLALALATLASLASCFVGPRGVGRGATSVMRAEATETETKPVKSGPSEEAIKTRSIFMSLDSDEFGIDEEQMKKTGIPTEETEPDSLQKVGDFISGPFILPFVVAVVAYLTYYVFFTKEAEKAFYYGSVNEKALVSGEGDSGFDFRALNPDMVDEIKEAMAQQSQTDAMDAGEATPEATPAPAE